MTATEQARFQELYIRHLRALKLQGKRDKTIDSYARAVRRVSSHFDCCPDRLTIERIRLDCVSEASHNLNRLLDKPGLFNGGRKIRKSKA